MLRLLKENPQLNAKTKYASKILNAGIPYRTETEITSLNGNKRLESITLKSPSGLESVVAQGVFVCIGLESNNGLAKQIGVDLDKGGYVVVDSHMATNIPGVYAAGDITGNLKQMVVAAAQGSIATYNLGKYLRAKCKE